MKKKESVVYTKRNLVSLLPSSGCCHHNVKGYILSFVIVYT
jgi:hypothetical protein